MEHLNAQYFVNFPQNSIRQMFAHRRSQTTTIRLSPLISCYLKVNVLCIDAMATQHNAYHCLIFDPIYGSLATASKTPFKIPLNWIACIYSNCYETTASATWNTISIFSNRIKDHTEKEMERSKKNESMGTNSINWRRTNVCKQNDFSAWWIWIKCQQICRMILNYNKWMLHEFNGISNCHCGCARVFGSDFIGSFFFGYFIQYFVFQQLKTNTNRSIRKKGAVITFSLKKTMCLWFHFFGISFKPWEHLNFCFFNPFINTSSIIIFSLFNMLKDKKIVAKQLVALFLCVI